MMLLFLFALIISSIETKVVDFYKDIGGIPNDSSLDVCIKNRDLINSLNNDLNSGDKFIVPNKTFYLMGGISLSYLDSIVFQLDGNLVFTKQIDKWPRDDNNNNNKVLDCFYFKHLQNITFTSNSKFGGIINGNGEKWWGIPFIGILIRGENRPKLFHIESASNIIIENIFFTNSPFWTVHIEDVKGLIIRNSTVINKRTNSIKNTLIDKSAFNTDGFDIQGENVHIHDCTIVTQDDCIAVKGTSRNMLFERIRASGVGLTIGSIGRDSVDNITFRDSYMPNTDKGIYMKFNGAANEREGGSITNILYENITITNPSEYAIWIGPAQQSDPHSICHANPCSLCWPMLSPLAQCNIPQYGNFSNITLSNIHILYEKGSFLHNKYIGVLMAPASNPMRNVRFNNVVIEETYKSNYPKRKYICKNVNGIADPSTTPIPDCF